MQRRTFVHTLADPLAMHTRSVFRHLISLERPRPLGSLGRFALALAVGALLAVFESNEANNINTFVFPSMNCI